MTSSLTEVLYKDYQYSIPIDKPTTLNAKPQSLPSFATLLFYPCPFQKWHGMIQHLNFTHPLLYSPHKHCCIDNFKKCSLVVSRPDTRKISHATTKHPIIEKDGISKIPLETHGQCRFACIHTLTGEAFNPGTQHLGKVWHCNERTKR